MSTRLYDGVTFGDIEYPDDFLLMQPCGKVIGFKWQEKTETPSESFSHNKKEKFSCCVCFEEKSEIPSIRCIHHYKHSEKTCQECDIKNDKCPLCRTPYV